MQKQCASDNCEEMFETIGARKFCDLHTPAKKKGSGKAKKVQSDALEEVTVVGIDLSEKQLDRLWSACTIEEKGLAVQTILDYQRTEE